MTEGMTQHGYPWIVDPDFDIQVTIENESAEGILLTEDDVTKMLWAIKRERALDNGK